ncbi:E3 ubiquitin-protein ligase MBR2-like [Quillaja saponaria]|uniref:RING-type E3 ubiquitin transferase n=1 Tax=Quillaja saponaria TaxID=32244 RepID=A0AAD7KRE2_QUISA|nr:E3 ubiquitin-protein ligase MBR2-like [Quillaja saponaria]
MNNQGWLGQFSSNSNTRNELSPHESFDVLSLISSPGAITEIGQRFYECHSESSCYTLQGSVSIVQSNCHSSGPSPHTIVVNERNINTTNQNMPLRLTPPTSNSSDPLVITSGVENDVLEGHSADGRHIPCKRKASENAFRGLYVGESSSSAFQTENSKRQAIPSQDSGNSILNIFTPYTNPPIVSHQEQSEVRVGTGILGAVSSMQQTFNEARQAERFHGNAHLQTAANIEGFLPSSTFSTTTINSQFQLPSQPTLFSQYGPCANLSLGQVPFIATPSAQPFVHIPNSLENLQSSPQVDTTRSRVGVAATYLAYAGNGSHTLGPSENLRNMPRITTLTPETGRRNWAHNATNLSFVNGNANFAANIASTHNASGSRTQLSRAPTRVPQHNLAEQYAQRLSGIATPVSLQSPGQSSYNPLVTNTSAASRAMGISLGGGNARTETLSRSGMGTRLESLASRYPRVHTARRRNRLVAEVQNSLVFLPRGGSLCFEDLMIQSMLANFPEENDLHDDMRLDVDNMSYEELLSLEEQIGNVCIGVSEKSVMTLLRRQKYESITVETQAIDEPCCICQEEYVDGEDLGNLDCGHNFHFSCIKQWLVLKNTCPICKMTALAVTNQDH